MNLESTPSKKDQLTSQEDFLMDDFDFKPITSGLGFHHSKPTEVKPVFTERVQPVAPQPQKEMSVYQNDLSIFYNQSTTVNNQVPVKEEVKVEKTYRLAGTFSRVVAYLADLLLVSSLLGIVLTVMARTISMDIMEVWSAFPHEITPLVFTLFVGFYVMYFSIFEKAPGSTLGKSLFNLQVLTTDDGPMTTTSLMLRSSITLLNFISLGLFSYFDLQNKITSSKVVKVK